MIFKCNLCSEEMHYLNTPGDEINNNLVCPRCANNIKETLKKIKQKLLDAGHQIPNFN